MRVIGLALLTAASLFFAGCEEVGEVPASTAVTAADRGFHFQGRDCLACHNYDLQQERHLVVAGTVFKRSSVSDVDDLTNSCNADLVINFTDGGGNIVYSTADYYDPDSKGYKGQGNLFLLDRLFNTTLNGTYNLMIVEKSSGLTLALGPDHEFSGACHHNGGKTAPIYVQTNLNLCQ